VRNALVWGGGKKGSGTVPHVDDLCVEEREGEQGGFAGDVKGRGVGEGSSDPEDEIGVREGSLRVFAQRKEKENRTGVWVMSKEEEWVRAGLIQRTRSG
jgi:hypothetical protein